METNKDNNGHFDLSGNLCSSASIEAPKKSIAHHFSYGHVNVRGLLNKLDVLIGYMISQKILIFSVVETNLRQDTNFFHPQVQTSEPDTNPSNNPLYEFVGVTRFEATGLTKARGGTGLFIHNALNFNNISDQVPHGLECTLVTFEYKSMTCIFASVYLPQSSDHEIVLFSKLLDVVCAMGSDYIIIAGDFNAWHPAWGDSTNKRGINLFDTITAHGMSVGKVPCRTREGDRRQRDTIVDFFVTNRIDLLGKTEVTIKVSDHFLILNHTRLPNSAAPPRKKVYDFHRSWKYCADQLNQHFDKLGWQDSLHNVSFAHIPSILNTLVLGVWDSVGISKYINADSRPWFCGELKQIRRECRKWERRYKACVKRGGTSHGNTLSAEECKKIHESTLDKYFSLLSKLRTDCEGYISKLLQANLHGTVRKLYKSSRRCVPTLKHKSQNGTFTVIADSDIQKASIFNKQFQSNSEIPQSFSVEGGERSEVYDNLNATLINYTVGSKGGITRISPCAGNCVDEGVVSLINQVSREAEICIDDPHTYPDNIDACNDFFSTTEVRSVRVRLKKGIGTIGINNDHIRKIDSYNVDVMYQFCFNLFFHYSYWPQNFRSADGTPIIKGGKRDLWDPGHYRLISITDTGGKFLEKLLYYRLNSLCGKHISDFQSGGVARNGCVQQIIRVVESVEANIQVVDFDEKGREYRPNHVVVALLDCSKAFDRMSRPVLLDILYKYGVRGKLFEMMVGFFHERFQRVRVGNSRSEYTTTPHGGPQGSVLTLFCWLLYINKICSLISNCKFGLFVDDIVLWVSDRNPASLVSRLNADLHRIYDWAMFHQMTFDFRKFHLLDVGTKLSPQARQQIRFGPGSPPWSSKAPYLGIILDDKLSFKPFLAQLENRIKESSWRLHKHSNFRYGATPRTLQVIFLTWLSPLFDYGSCVWIFRMYHQSTLHYSCQVDRGYRDIYKRLNSLYMGFLRNVLSVPDKTSNLAVLVRVGAMPLNYMLAYRSAIWYLKLIKGLCGPALRDLHTRFLNNDEAFGSTHFFKPARDFVRRLNKYCAHVNLETCSIVDAKRLLRDAIYDELSTQWVANTEARICHSIHPTWKPLRWQREMKSKLTCTWYHEVAVGRGRFRSYLFKCGRAQTQVCRLCDNEAETVDHIFFHCTSLLETRKPLRKACDKLGYDFNLQNLFTKPKLQRTVEEFLYDIFIRKFKDPIDGNHPA